MNETIPPEALLASYPEPMRGLAEHLRRIVRTTLPDAIEAVRPGWRIIGYDLPIGRRRTVYFAWVMTQHEHVHLGFPRGVLMADRERMLEGAGITKQARWVTLRPGHGPAEPPVVGPDDDQLAHLVREAAAVAGLSKAERLARALDEPGWGR